MKNLLVSVRWPRPRGLLGVDIGASGVHVVELRQQRGVLACRHHGMAALPQGDPGNPDYVEALAAAIRQACLASGSRARCAALALSEDSLITQTLRLPAGLPEEQLEILVELEAAQYMPFALEDASLDFCLLGPAPAVAGTGGHSEIEVLLVAARRSSVQQRVAQASGAGLQAVAVDSAALASDAALQHDGWRALPGGQAYQLAWGLALHGLAP